MVISLKYPSILRRTAVLCALLVLCLSSTAGAVTFVVPTDFATIQAAIDQAEFLLSQPTNTNSFIVLVEPGTYPGGITLKSNIPLRGRETGRTILSGGGAGTIITAANVSGASVRNMTFRNAAVGISASGSSSITIENNVFSLGVQGTAVQMATPAAGRVANNTFLLNNIALALGSNTVQIVNIVNNIFSNNTTNITGWSSSTPVTFNTFHPINNTEFRGTSFIPNTAHPDPDPLFVNANAFDLHLLSGPTGSSPCVDTGDPTISDPYLIPPQSTNISDMGAYGGPSADTVPLPVTSVLTSATSTAPYTITLNWAADLNYLVGGYKVYYGHAPGTYTGTDAIISGGSVTSSSPINTNAQTSLALEVNPASVAPTAPLLLTPSPRNGGLVLSWTAAPGATGYKVHYALASAPTATTTISIGNTNSFTLTGLINGQIYDIAVSSVSQAIYYLAVTSHDVSGQAGTPGVSHESDYSVETQVAVGPVSESGLSNVMTGMPEVIVPFPNLPNTGCFIATAAYGSASAPAVQVLRQFRDRWLLTNAPGTTFVRWYYANSPAAARTLEQHPALKPLARALLAPLVAAAFLAVEFPALAIAALFVTAGLVLRRRRKARARKTSPGERGIALRTTLLLTALTLLTPAAVSAAEPPVELPHWSAEIKGGWFYPAIDNWETYYGRNNTWQYAGSIAYKVTRRMEIGLEGGYIRDNGQGYAPLNNVIAGPVVYQAFPLNVFVLFRGVFNESQLIVPYVGGGWTRMFYREVIENQGTVRGSADGYHGRAGLQFLLDDADRTAARNLFHDFGIDHTYFFTEVQLTRVTVGTPAIDIGGTSYLMGLLFEF